MGNVNQVIDKAVSIVGSKSALANKLNITKQAVHNWYLASKVPAERCLEIEELTNGAVTCEQLRPDLNWSILRSTSDA